MNLTITPGNTLQGETKLPGDKSISHRAALLAAMAEGESQIENFLISGVTRVILGALSSLSVAWELEGTRLWVQSEGWQGWRPPAAPIDCGNSATSLRLLAGALAAAGAPATLDGTPGLRARPMQRIIEPLQQMGVVISGENGRAPLRLSQSRYPLRPLDYTMPVASAQVKSCLLLAALAADGQTILREPAPSRDHSERLLRSLGVQVTSEQIDRGDFSSPQYLTCLNPPRPLSLPPLRLKVPGDFSAAAFLIVATLITPGSRVTLRGVGLNPTRTGLLDALRAMGAKIHLSASGEQNGEPIGDLTVEASSLGGVCVEGPLVVRMIDEFPAFAIAAAYAQGKTVVRQAEELRYKESDRIAALCGELSALGVQVEETQDGFSIRGGAIPQGGIVQSHGDHRLAMALAVAGLASQEPVTVIGAEAADESFPDFVKTLRELGGGMAFEG